MFKKSLNKLTDRDVLIGKECSVQGSIISQETVKIGGKIEGDITAKDVIVAGRVRGNINAEGTIKIKNKAVVTGDVKGYWISIDDGGVLSGKCEITGEHLDNSFLQLEKELADGEFPDPPQEPSKKKVVKFMSSI
jgi:cytoskeletal protein CcmA (bactofilin family)